MRRLFTRAEAIEAGLDPAVLRGAAYRSISRGLYCRSGDQPSQAEIVRALLRKLPAAEFACRETAAVLLGGVVPHSSEIHLGSPQRRSSKRPDVALHWYRAAPELARVDGIVMTTARQTFLDLAATLTFVDLLVLGDSLVHKKACGIEVFSGLEPGRRPGSVRAREVAALVRKGVESPYETRTRLLVTSCGLPEPIVNHPVRDEDGRVRRRIDLAYVELKIAIEYDGRHHIERQQQWQGDIGRREELEGEGWRFIVVTSSDIHGSPGGVAGRVHHLLRERGYTGGFDPFGWRRHFAP